MSGRTYLRFIDAWQSAGYRIVKLIFLRLDTPRKRLAWRNAFIKADTRYSREVIRRRYYAGSGKFHHHYAPRVDA